MAAVLTTAARAAALVALVGVLAVLPACHPAEWSEERLPPAQNRTALLLDCKQVRPQRPAGCARCQSGTPSDRARRQVRHVIAIPAIAEGDHLELFFRES